MTMTKGDMGSANSDNMRPEPLFFQTGYLTISDYEPKTSTYTLAFPNTEVRAAFFNSLLEHYAGSGTERKYAENLKHALVFGDIKMLEDALRSIFAAVPYTLAENTEKYFQTVVYMATMMAGLRSVPEDPTSDGRIDAVVETIDYVYCFEFKLRGTAEEALAQIDTKKYTLKFRRQGKKIFKVGVSFDYERKNIDKLLYQVECMGVESDELHVRMTQTSDGAST